MQDITIDLSKVVGWGGPHENMIQKYLQEEIAWPAWEPSAFCYDAKLILVVLGWWSIRALLE